MTPKDPVMIEIDCRVFNVLSIVCAECLILRWLQLLLSTFQEYCERKAICINDVCKKPAFKWAAESVF